MDLMQLAKEYWWVLLAVAALWMFKDQLNLSGILKSIMGFFTKSSTPSPTPGPAPIPVGTVTQADALGAYNTLTAYLVHCPEGTKQLNLLWPHLEPGHVHSSDAKPAEVKA